MVAAAVSMVMVATATIVAIAVGLTEGDQDSNRADTPTSQSPSEPTGEPSDNSSADPSDTAEAPSSPTASSSSSTSANGVMTGQSYTYKIPDGWFDITDKLASQPTVDTVSADRDSIEASSISLIVEVGSTFGFKTPAALKETWKKTLKTATGVDPVDTANDMIAGRPAVTVRMAQPKVGDLELIQYGWLLIVDNVAVSIVLTTSQADKSAAMAMFDKIMATWEWT